MYMDFYGLKALPFQLTPDASFFFESSVHSKAMAHLKYGLQQAEGFIVITGDIGAGKTTLVERLCATLDPNRYVVAKISTTQTSADDLLRMVAAGFGIRDENLNKGDLIRRFESIVKAYFHSGRRLLLLVDEAQHLTLAALEELRMMSNVIVGNRAPLQSFLLGQPQFRSTLALPETEQLRQRVLASYHLGPLGEEETKAYIEHRLRVAGWQDDPKFTPGAYQRIAEFTNGIPRKINTLCARLMLFGFLEEIRVIDAEAALRVATELNLEVCGGLATVHPAPRAAYSAAAEPAWLGNGQSRELWPFPIQDIPRAGPANAITASRRGLKADGKQLFAASLDTAARYVTRRFS